MNRVLNQESCLEKIEELRKKMVTAAEQYGMSHPIVLRYSQELDRAHNKMILLEVSPNWTNTLSY
ncbi:aspartyl-phosphate phosphatase Spo0E family protein [Halalkalibacter krulwichiae]|nr:aspartyl-phosphate phosphatase Spo0E family protein [Halalkalibacter krulwichiae]